MPTLHLQADHIVQATKKAMILVRHLTTLGSLPRTYVAEMIVVRLFAHLEAVVEDSACRLVCGAQYCDGSSPALQRACPTRGFERARGAMATFGRTECRPLRWNKASEIRKNLDHLFPANEHFIGTIVGHGQFISDLRKVRNHVAHCTPGTRGKFDEVVRNYYGASVNGMTPGRMLLSSRFSPLLLETFCLKTQIILLSAIKA